MRRSFILSTVIISVILSAMLASDSLLAEETPRRDLPDVWNDEYQELAGQIKRLKNWKGVRRRRLRDEALDQQALTQAEDKDPLDIVLRRTDALLRHFENQGQLAAEVLEKFSSRLKQLAVSAKSTPDAEPRKALFMAVCKLRREIALANPLLDFDDTPAKTRPWKSGESAVRARPRGGSARGSRA